MHIGLGGLLVVIWFVALLFGDAETRDNAITVAGLVLGLALLAALGIGALILMRR